VRTPTHLFGRSLLANDDAGNTLFGESVRQDLFYDLRDDGGEMANLAGTGQQSETEEELRSLLEDWHAETPWLAMDNK